MSSDSGTVGADTGLPAKGVSWVELYFDLVYVYVHRQRTHSPAA
ncbi:hypothetical protein [Streptomyces fildesensis]|nr:hypothetical protein [Streptomyces fildesensis]